MSKIILSNRIWIPKELETREIIEGCLHKVPLNEYEKMLSTARGGLPYRLIKTYTRPTATILSIPIGRMDLVPKGDDIEIVDKRHTVPQENFPQFSGQLRPSQQDAVDFAERYGNIVIKARPGWGKTFTACAIASKFKQKTLIVVHTIALMEQWIKEIEKVLHTSCGIIGDSQYAIGDFITVGIIKSVHKNRLHISKEFGLIVVDEVHHLPAEQFSEFINSNYAKYKIGMSGTLERTDKTHVVIFDYISTMIFSAPDENVMTPKINVITLPIDFNVYTGNYAQKITQLNEDPLYIKCISDICKTYAKKGHKVLCVMERVLAIELVAAQCNAIPYHYSTPKSEKVTAFARMKSGEKNILVGSVKIFSEGISESYLGCLVLGLSMRGPPLEQVVGRVIRELEGKLQPIIVDIRMKGRSMAEAAAARDTFYENMGYEVVRYKS